MSNYDQDLDRRDFLKGVGAVGVTAATAGCTASASQRDMPVRQVPGASIRNLGVDYVGKTLEELEQELPQSYEVDGVIYQLSDIEESAVLPDELKYEAVNADVGNISFASGVKDKPVADVIVPVLEGGEESGSVRDIGDYSDPFGFFVDHSVPADGDVDEVFGEI